MKEAEQRQAATAEQRTAAEERAAQAERRVSEEAAQRIAAQERAAQAERRVSEEAAQRIAAQERAAQAERRVSEEAAQRIAAQERLVQAERGISTETSRRTEAEQRAAQSEKSRAEAEERLASQAVELGRRNKQTAQLEGELGEIRGQYEELLHSTFWLATGPARRLAAGLPPSVRRQMRRSARVAYWLVTPQRTRERIAYFRSRDRSLPALSAATAKSGEGEKPDVEAGLPAGRLEGFESSCQEPDLSRKLAVSQWTDQSDPVTQVGIEQLVDAGRDPDEFGQKLAFCYALRSLGLFDPVVYQSLHHDVRDGPVDPWTHFVNHGWEEGRQFTNCETVARVLADLRWEMACASRDFEIRAERALAADRAPDGAEVLRRRGARIGVFCNSEGNFFMREIANLLAWGLQEQKIDTVQRDETADFEESFDLRIFVAPQEFFTLGRGRNWMHVFKLRNTVVFNVDQVQSPWFCRAFPLLARAALVLDINFQSAEILRRAGCKAIHVMPGYLPEAPYVQPYRDVSNVLLLKGYDFAQPPYNWLEQNALKDRPIDVLFIGTRLPRRDETFAWLQPISDTHRLVCVTTPEQQPMTARNHRTNSTEINCALGQRAKDRAEYPPRLAWLFRMVTHGIARFLAGSLRGVGSVPCSSNLQSGHTLPRGEHSPYRRTDSLVAGDARGARRVGQGPISGTSDRGDIGVNAGGA